MKTNSYKECYRAKACQETEAETAVLSQPDSCDHNRIFSDMSLRVTSYELIEGRGKG